MGLVGTVVVFFHFKRLRGEVVDGRLCSSISSGPRYLRVSVCLCLSFCMCAHSNIRVALCLHMLVSKAVLTVLFVCGEER